MLLPNGTQCDQWPYNRNHCIHRKRHHLEGTHRSIWSIPKCTDSLQSPSVPIAADSFHCNSKHWPIWIKWHRPGFLQSTSATTVGRRSETTRTGHDREVVGSITKTLQNIKKRVGRQWPVLWSAMMTPNVYFEMLVERLEMLVFYLNIWI